MKITRKHLLAIVGIVILVGSSVWDDDLSAQRVHLTSPREVEVVGLLGQEVLPIPVEVPEGIAIKEMPPVEVKNASGEPLPPWVQSGEPWIGNEALQIQSVVGPWVELTNAVAIQTAHPDVPVPGEFEAGILRLWIYLPTGKVYGRKSHRQTYQRLTD